MKSIVAKILILIFIFFNSNAQRPDEIIFRKPILIKATKNINDTIKIGKEFKLYSIPNFKFTDSKQVIPYLNLIGIRGNGEAFNHNTSLEFKELKKFEIVYSDDIDYAWDSFLLKNDFFPMLVEKGMQYDLRSQLEEDNLEYLKKLEANNMIFKDEYFEDYMYSILSKLHFGILSDGRPGNLTVKIMNDTEPNAFCLSNGTILITTGMLSTIESEDELVGILAHEVAHFVLDHQILNYNASIDRKKRAEFWSGLAIAAAATADIFMATKNENHPIGVLTYSATIAATIISSEVLEKLGIKYSQSQENDADWAAGNVAEILKYDKDGITTALKRVRFHLISTGNYLALNGGKSHPKLDDRIGRDFKPVDNSKYSKIDYLKKVSLINTYNAQNELWNSSHIKKAQELVDKNIKSGVAIEMDYLIKAIIIRRLFNNKEKIEESLTLIQKAKSLNVNSPIVIDKEEAITLLRLKRNLEAKKSLEAYLSNLIALQKSIDNDGNSSNDSDQNLIGEIDWTKKMIYKSNNL